MAYEVQPIENHGVIGDLHTVALVAMDGAIDFMCFPRFDSPTIFAALLDGEKGGRFQISPELPEARRKQLYLPDSNILLTRFLAEGGVAEISDFMPVSESGGAHNVVRRVKTVRGEVRFHICFAPRFNYGRSGHRCEQQDDFWLFTSDGPDGLVLRLRSSIALEIREGEAHASFTLKANETASFVLEDARAELACNVDRYVVESFKNTLSYWRAWMNRCTYTGRWRETVNRSALALKLLVSKEFGSLVAAPTFALPEMIGGHRNWDYRYTWIRDASFTTYAFLRLGYTEEASGFMNWIEQRCEELQEDGSLQIMYGLDGRHELTELELPHWSGFRESRPVRIGNGAASQLQLDIYGELLDSVYLFNKWGRPISHGLWVQLVRLLEWVCRNWRQPDHGIWEVRGGKHDFLFSRVMCWVALDRGIRLVRARSFPAPLTRWIETRDEIYRSVFQDFWNPQRGAFRQSTTTETVDASSLLLPLMKFISPVDPMWLSNMQAVKEDLVEDSLVHRYRIGRGVYDGFEDTEGTFSMCTFWYAECLARGGDPLQGRYVFEKALGYANHCGLWAEQLGARGEHLGNFPQAFTHLGLISAAYALDRTLDTGTCSVTASRLEMDR